MLAEPSEAFFIGVDGDAIPVAEATDAFAQVGGEAVVLDGAKCGLLGSIMSGLGVSELFIDERGDGFGLELVFRNV